MNGPSGLDCNLHHHYSDRESRERAREIPPPLLSVLVVLLRCSCELTPHTADATATPTAATAAGAGAGDGATKNRRIDGMPGFRHGRDCIMCIDLEACRRCAPVGHILQSGGSVLDPFARDN